MGCKSNTLFGSVLDQQSLATCSILYRQNSYRSISLAVLEDTIVTRDFPDEPAHGQDGQGRDRKIQTDVDECQPDTFHVYLGFIRKRKKRNNIEENRLHGKGFRQGGLSGLPSIGKGARRAP